MRGGTDIFGLLNGVDANSSDFDSVRLGAPANAVGAVIRQHLGPTGYATDFTGYDALLFINLTGQPLPHPFLGDDPAMLDGAFETTLLTGGTASFWNNTGPQLVADLDGFEIFETLIPSYANWINASADGTIPVGGAPLGEGGVAYLLVNASAVPEATTQALGLGLALLELTLRLSFVESAKTDFLGSPATGRE